MSLSAPGAGVPGEDEGVEESTNGGLMRGGMEKGFEKTGTDRVEVEVEEENSVGVEFACGSQAREGVGGYEKGV